MPSEELLRAHRFSKILLLMIFPVLKVASTIMKVLGDTWMYPQANKKWVCQVSFLKLGYYDSRTRKSCHVIKGF